MKVCNVRMLRCSFDDIVFLFFFFSLCASVPRRLITKHDGVVGVHLFLRFVSCFRLCFFFLSSFFLCSPSLQQVLVLVFFLFSLSLSQARRRSKPVSAAMVLAGDDPRLDPRLVAKRTKCLKLYEENFDSYTDGIITVNQAVSDVLHTALQMQDQQKWSLNDALTEKAYSLAFEKITGEVPGLGFAKELLDGAAKTFKVFKGLAAVRLANL